MSTAQPESFVKMEIMAKRKIAYGMLIEFDSDDDDMRSIGKKFAGIGWKNFFEIFEDIIYDSLVQQFYEHNNWLKYMVKCAMSRIDAMVELVIKIPALKKEITYLRTKLNRERVEIESSNDLLVSSDLADVDDDDSDED
ncbi:hypothetical protein L6164_023830 [Bauhinia variegata]|uniref:Uncharacterized protein n=1 Tax=Bauhinia variegata TaxID=167791 RepID=A0ACB9MJQ8_BAUVA|nr:hypothetical protein L6164_023830 [Bauhinia variegata]